MPPIGTPEHREWVIKKTAKAVNDIFGDDYKPADFEEGGVIFGDIEDLDKTDAELYPDELDMYTPEERRKLFKLHKKDGGDKKDDDK